MIMLPGWWSSGKVFLKRWGSCDATNQTGYLEWALWYLLITLFHNPQDTWSSRSQTLYLEMRDHEALLTVSGAWWAAPSTPLPYTSWLLIKHFWISFFFFLMQLWFSKSIQARIVVKNDTLFYQKEWYFISLLRDGFFGFVLFFCFDNLLSLKIILGISPAE